MTEDFTLPPDLQRLEQDLAARERPQPPDLVKQRLLCSVRTELHRSRTRGRWAFTLAMAATVLVWLNLSISATQATDCGLGLKAPHQSVRSHVEQIHQLLPDLSPQEATRQAVLLRAGSGVVLCPKLPAGDVALQRDKLRKELNN